MRTTTLCKLLLFLIVAPGWFRAYPQNIFDSLHTAEYANFLFLSGNYKLASEEYERLTFLSSPNEFQKLRLVKSYRLSGEPVHAIKRIKQFWAEPESVSANVAGEYLNLQIINGSFQYAFELAAQNEFLNINQKRFYQVSALMLDENFGEALELIQSNTENASPVISQYLKLCTEAISTRAKSPALSGIMSAVVPGSGKIYTGEWQDGLSALAFIASTAWQSYRGFKKNGISSAYGWIMGTVSTGFYAANIYGSVKSANKYNVNRRNNINIRVQAVFYNSIH